MGKNLTNILCQVRMQNKCIFVGVVFLCEIFLFVVRCFLFGFLFYLFTFF